MADPRRLEETREWLRYAAEDLETAELLLDTVPSKIRQSLFAAQQAAEKALKAFLIYHGRFYPLTHNLRLLSDVCSELDGSLTAVIAPALPLTDFAVRFRYPGTAWDEIDASDAARWVSAAKGVYRAVVERIGS